MAEPSPNRKMTKQEAGRKGGEASAKSRKNRLTQTNKYIVL